MFIFTILSGASKGYMKSLMAFTKLYETPQRTVKIKTSINFYFTVTFRNARGGKGTTKENHLKLQPIRPYSFVKYLH